MKVTVLRWGLCFAVSASSALACGVPLEAQSRRARAKSDPADVPSASPAESPIDVGELPTTEDPVEVGPRVVDSSLAPDRPAFQTKSSSQLASSIRVCVGTGATTISSAMIVGGGAGAFLTTDFKAGDDIVLVQRSGFDGNADALKTGVRIDQITLEYITALKNAGNVVGFRCAQGLVSDPSMCACGTFPTAYSMLSRCLGGVIDPSSPAIVAIAAEFATACVANKGKAIASLVASAAFAKLP
jgi:hypothetical protein